MAHHTSQRDNNKWVKGAAYKSLGHFIETLSGVTQPNPALLTEFCRVTATDVKECYNDENEVLRECAFVFPAVLATFGASKWPVLQRLFNALMRVNDKQVRKPLACALHELAKIIGPQQAEKDLIAVLDAVLKDRGTYTCTHIHPTKTRKSSTVQLRTSGSSSRSSAIPGVRASSTCS